MIYLLPLNLSMPAEVADAYKSASQRTRVVTEAWGADNLYCPNCSSPRLERLAHNTKASDFSCPKCNFKYQLKGQQKRIGNRINDGAYETMLEAVRSNHAPNYFFMHYELPNWTIRSLLLIPKFAFPPSAIVKRNPLSPTAERHGWVGCNFALDRIPADARIDIVREQIISPSMAVREQFRKVKSAFAELPVLRRGWMLDVLNVVRKLPPGVEFKDKDVYVFAPELKALHPDNENIEAKIRQQLQYLRNRGFLIHLGPNRWRAG